MSGPILVPIALGPPNVAKVLAAQEQGLALQAPLLLLHVLPPAAVQPAAVSPAEATARAALDALAIRLRAAGVAAQTLIRSGRTAATILDVARTQHARVIILGSTIRGRVPRALLGSVADTVIREASCPVLLVRSASPMDPAQALLTLDPPDLLRAKLIGRRSIEMSRIVGSATRVHELGPNFRLLHPSSSDEDRFRNLLAAMTRGEELPSVELYKFGFGYYVRDGHHRVAAARELGRPVIDATVTELVPPGDAAEQAFAARHAFEQVTGIATIGAARIESYGHLIAAIEAYRREQGLDSLPAAADRWYTTVYQPLWRRVRTEDQTQRRPGDRPADVIGDAAAWRATASKHTGAWPAWDEALRQTGSAG